MSSSCHLMFWFLSHSLLLLVICSSKLIGLLAVVFVLSIVERVEVLLEESIIRMMVGVQSVCPLRMGGRGKIIHAVVFLLESFVGGTLKFQSIIHSLSFVQPGWLAGVRTLLHVHDGRREGLKSEGDVDGVQKSITA